MFKAGDHIVHVRHGAGVVLEPRKIEREGEVTEYFCVELSNGRGMVMVPAANVDPEEIRLAMTNIDLIDEVMHHTPEDLHDDHRARQNKIKANIKSRDPRILAATLRDLAWRETTDKLTYTDSQLKEKVQRLLAQELALDPSVAIETARKRITNLVDEAMAHHMTSIEA